MSSPSSCPKCERVVDVLSSRGLCLACAATDNTPDPTPPIARPRPADFSTATAGSDVSSDAPTASARLAAETGGAPSEARPPLPHPPAGYEIVKRLGGGGMGDVYLAREQASDRLVAMKFLRNAGNPDTFDRFVVELKSLAKLDHPHIVRVLAHDFLRAQPYFTMEYLPGGTLSRQDGAALPSPAAAVGLFRTVAVAIAAAHARQVIHRDLKPSNVLLDANGIPKVADFGLAKRLDELDDLTPTVGALGTPGYMPPEQISRKNGDIGPWSDVYGLGATLYALLTGEAPFDGPTPADVMHQVLADAPMRLRARRPELPLGLEAVVLKCLAKDPKDRYATVADLLADLDSYEAGRKQVAPLMTPARRLKVWVSRNRRGLVAATTAAVLLAVVFVLGAAPWSKPAPANPPAPPDPLKKMQDELVAGRPVTLIGKTGLPEFSRSVFEPTQLGASPLGDQTCSFHAFRYALVELCPDPMVDHYRVDLELRRLGRHDPAVGEETDWLGFYFGYSSGPTTEPATGHLAFGVKFKDYAPRVVPGRPPDPAAVYFQTLDFLQESGNLLDSSPGKLGHLKITPSSRLGKAGEWRPLSVEVSPARVLVLWRSDGGKEWVTLADWPRDQIEAAYERRKRNLAKMNPSATGLLPWEPRMPFGLAASKSAVSVRNVIVTPSPKKPLL